MVGQVRSQLVYALPLHSLIPLVSRFVSVNGFGDRARKIKNLAPINQIDSTSILQPFARSRVWASSETIWWYRNWQLVPESIFSWGLSGKLNLDKYPQKKSHNSVRINPDLFVLERKL